METNEYVPVSKREFLSIVGTFNDYYDITWVFNDGDYEEGYESLFDSMKNVSERILMKPCTYQQTEDSYPYFELEWVDREKGVSGFVNWTFGEKSLKKKKSYTITINVDDEIDVEEFKKNHPTAKIESWEYYAD